MKRSTVLLLIVLISAVFLPLKVAVSHYDACPSLVALDVCNSNYTGISVTADGPAIQESAGMPLPLEISGYIRVSKSSNQNPPFILKQDRPPEA